MGLPRPPEQSNRPLQLLKKKTRGGGEPVIVVESGAPPGGRKGLEGDHNSERLGSGKDVKRKIAFDI